MLEGLVVLSLLLLGNAFFVGAEFSLVAARRSAIELQALDGSRAARVTLGAMERVSIMMAAAQLGITICSLGIGALGEPFIAHYLEMPLHNAGISDALLHPIALVIALAVMTYLHVVLGEMIPKNIALAGPDRAALLLTPLLVLVVKVMYPGVISLNYLANLTTRAFGVKPKDEVASTFTRDEVAGFVEESRREGLLSEDEEHLLSGSLSFDKQTVRSVLLSIDSLVIVGPAVTTIEIERLVAETGFSRFPVQTEAGKLIGYIHLKDTLDIKQAKRDQPLDAKYFRTLVDVSISDPLRVALNKMRRAGSHVALVKDTTKQTLGIVTLEDIVEELVGQINDTA